MPIDGKGRAGKRCRTERALVEAPPGVAKAPAVAPEHLDIGEKMVTERHRLCRLEMGESRHHGCGMLDRPISEHGWLVSKPGSLTEAARRLMRPVGDGA